MMLLYPLTNNLTGSMQCGEPNRPRRAALSRLKRKVETPQLCSPNKPDTFGAMPGLDNRNPVSVVVVQAKSQSAPMIKINGNAGYSNTGACLTPKRDKDRTSQQQVLTTAKQDVRTLLRRQTTSYRFI